MMGKDIFNEIDTYIDELKSAKCFDYANKVHEAKLSGAIGSEIIGLVSLELKKAKEELGKDQGFLIKKANLLLDEIKKINAQRKLF
jgi:hypothetical protein